MSTSQIEDRVRKLRIRRNDQRRKERSKLKRAAAVADGSAVTLSPREFSELSGLSLASTYRRVADGSIRSVKIGARLLILRDQLPG